ncbi:MAG: hypothetical protein D6705_13475 [Deltaproteobacteria bacterium]|nr:MAG: hypothetical protein D6705_13475 [Deltaproteobacteria bacterium]
MQRTSLTSQVSLDTGGRDVATLQRHEYEVLGTAAGKDKTTRVFVLWFPVGQHKSASEVWDGAYYDAVHHVEGCDGLLLPRAQTKRIVVPLLLVNVIVKRTAVEGRCIRVKTDEELEAQRRRHGHGRGLDPHHGKGTHSGMEGHHGKGPHPGHGPRHGAKGRADADAVTSDAPEAPPRQRP